MMIYELIRGKLASCTLQVQLLTRHRSKNIANKVQPPSAVWGTYIWDDSLLEDDAALRFEQGWVQKQINRSNRETKDSKWAQLLNKQSKQYFLGDQFSKTDKQTRTSQLPNLPIAQNWKLTKNNP